MTSFLYPFEFVRLNIILINFGFCFGSAYVILHSPLRFWTMKRLFHSPGYSYSFLNLLPHLYRVRPTRFKQSSFFWTFWLQIFSFFSSLLFNFSPPPLWKLPFFANLTLTTLWSSLSLSKLARYLLCRRLLLVDFVVLFHHYCHLKKQYGSRMSSGVLIWTKNSKHRLFLSRRLCLADSHIRRFCYWC